MTAAAAILARAAARPTAPAALVRAALRRAPRRAPASAAVSAAVSAAAAAAMRWPSASRCYATSTVIKVPPMAESISDGTLKQWLKAVGDHVEQDEEVATIETDKIDVAVNAPEAGVITEIFAKEEETVTVGQKLATLEPGAAAPEGAKSEKVDESAKPKKPEESDTSDNKDQPNKQDQPDKKAQPEQKQAPAESKSESKPAPHSRPPPSSSSSSSSSSTPSSSTSSSSASSTSAMGSRGENRVKMNRIRLRTAERLKQSQNTAAALTTFQEVDMSAVMAFRSRYKDDVLEATGVKLGFMSAFSRACVLAMRDLPAVNAAIEESGDTIVFRDYVDISVAVATEKGLVTPVIRNVESLDLIGIEKAIADMGEKARNGRLTIEDMAGGTFTISNGGVFGSMMGTPIINYPQTAVLGLHAIKDRPVVVDRQIVIRPVMFLALTYDHRLLDGREAVLFLVKVKQFIEDPMRMLL